VQGRDTTNLLADIESQRPLQDLHFLGTHQSSRCLVCHRELVHAVFHPLEEVPIFGSLDGWMAIVVSYELAAGQVETDIVSVALSCVHHRRKYTYRIDEPSICANAPERL
jgi:hypothetical protein